jgi:ankyrin repeat protein
MSFRVDAQDAQGDTLLHRAVANNDLQAVLSLLQKNARLHICNKEGKSPMRESASSAAAARYLLSEGRLVWGGNPEKAALQRVRIHTTLVRHEAYHAQCRRACILVYFCLRRHLYKDVARHIVKMLWETRGTAGTHWWHVDMSFK